MILLRARSSPATACPRERDLAEQMKISKTIVHLGLEDLARMGFIEVTPRRGTVVADFAETGNLETLNAILRYNGGKLDRQMVVSISGAAQRDRGRGADPPGPAPHATRTWRSCGG